MKLLVKKLFANAFKNGEFIQTLALMSKWHRFMDCVYYKPVKKFDTRNALLFFTTN